MNLQETFRVLAEDLKDPDPALRETAAERLGSLGGTEVVALLATVLSNADPHVRASVVAAFGALRDEAAVPYLIRTAQSDKSEPVRIGAAISLDNYRSEEVLECLLGMLEPEHPATMRMEVAFQMWKYNEERTIQALRHLVCHDPRRNVRLWAAESRLFLFRENNCPREWNHCEIKSLVILQSA